VTGIPQPSMNRIGLWDYHLNYHPVSEVRAWVAELEKLGVGSIWVGEASFREPLTLAGILLAETSEVTVATGIANIWARDPDAMTAAQITLCEAYPGRFLLGVGVSHAALTVHRGHHYAKPLTSMRRYLDGMDEAWDKFRGVKPVSRPPRILAALGPRMLELAATRAAGAHTYLVPPEHTEQARRILGPDAALIPEQAVVLDDEPERARRLARAHVRRYLPLMASAAELWKATVERIGEVQAPVVPGSQPGRRAHRSLQRRVGRDGIDQHPAGEYRPSNILSENTWSCLRSADQPVSRR
jgi:probable F420-dependent oxidoreductase